MERPLTVLDGARHSSQGAMLLVPMTMRDQSIIDALTVLRRTYEVHAAYNAASKTVTLISTTSTRGSIAHISEKFWDTIRIEPPTPVSIGQLLRQS